MNITSYNAICNLGNNIDEIYDNALEGNITCFKNLSGYLENPVRIGLINVDLDDIKDENFNLRCNKLLLKNLELLNKEINNLYKKYSKEDIGIIVATTNSGVEEYEKSKNQHHSELGNPAYFLHKHLGSGFYITVSTACSSGIKAFSLARDLIQNKICKAIVLANVDTLAKIPLYGFNSLEVLSNNPSIPFSSDREGMNIGEASAIFILEEENYGIEILGIGESSDIFHPTTPDPEAKESIKAIKIALDDAKLKPNEIDYINAHGTGTIANDIMESNAIYNIFKDKVPVSSTKPMTGHCLGAGAGIEIALCAKLIEDFRGKYYPHIYDNCFDEKLAKIKLVKDEKYEKCNICMCNSFGFGGVNTIIILGKNE